MINNDENLVTITEQGNLGLGIGQVKDDKEREALKKRLNEMQEKTDKNRRN